MKGWLLLGVVVVSAVTAYVLNFAGVIAFSSSDGSAVAARISAELTARAGQAVHVTCPAKIPEKKGGIEDCQASAGSGSTLVRVVQDDSRGHMHWNVGDPAALVAAPSPDPSPSTRSTYSSVTLACIGNGGAPGQCGCVEQQIREHGTDIDLARAAAAYNTSGRLPDDLAAMADACRQGA